jgi:Fur family ferric uptake transcriptional regulator
MIKKRQTVSKKKVLQFFKENEQAMSHDMIEDALQGDMDRVTIYRILKSFEEDGILHKIMGENGKSYYALCHNCTSHHAHNHLHFQCSQCEKVECIHHEIVVPIPKGYEVKNLQLTATGICAKCLSGESAISA